MWKSFMHELKDEGRLSTPHGGNERNARSSSMDADSVTGQEKKHSIYSVFNLIKQKPSIM